MKKLKLFRCLLLMLIIVCACSISVSAQVWEFGTSGPGRNPFTAKGFAIKTESGQVKWLYSKFSNGGYDASGDIIMQDGGTTYTGTGWGVQYINAAKTDGKSYKLFALTNRNPEIYYYMFAYQKKSQNGDFTAISNFTSHLGAPFQTSTDLVNFPNGIDHELAIPIDNFIFEPGTLYEFGFQQGMQAHNGISLVLSGDGAGHYYGYLQNDFTAEEKALYDKMKHVEYQFISSYTKVPGTNYYNVNFVPMRFSVQTFADLSAWNATEAEVQSFINGVTQSDYDSGRYCKTNIDNLKAELSSIQNKLDNVVKYQLKAEADQSISQMINEITTNMNTAKTTKTTTDMTKLDEKLQTANDFYDDAKNNVGTEEGNYSNESVDILKQTINMASTLTNQSLQSDIDNAVVELENAIINVKSSKIETDKIILSDFVNGITVTLNKGSVPDNVSLIVNRVDDEDERYKTYEDSIGKNVKEIKIFDVLLYSGDNKIQSSQPITVQFPVPDSMKSNDISVYLSGDDLKAGEVSSLRTESFVQVNSNTTGYFSLVSFGEATVDKSEDSGDSKSEDSGDSKSEDSGDSKSEDSDDSKSEDSDDSKSEDSGDSKSEDSDDSKSEDSGDSKSEDSGDSKSEDSGDSKSEDSGDSKSEDRGDSTAVVTKTVSNGNVDVIKQTDLSTKKNPDEKENLLDITAGLGNTAMSVTLNGENRQQEKIVDTVIPVSEVLKKGNPFWLLLTAAVLAIFGTVYDVALIILGKFKKY